MALLERDVVIAGAGIAGLALAATLLRKGLSVAILEAGERPTLPVLGTALSDWDQRVSALTPHSTDFLEALGVWPRLQERRVGPYEHMVVWDAVGTGRIHFSAASLGIPKLGDIVENRLTIDALLQVVEGYQDLDLLWGESFDRVYYPDDTTLCVTTSSGRQLQTPLLVGADGARSSVRERQGFSVRQWSYDQHAVVATVQLAGEHQNACYQAFLPSGPLALLPLADASLCSIVWSLDDDCWESRMALDGRSFVAALNRALGDDGPEVVAVSGRAAFPLRQSHAVDYSDERIVLVADAAHSIHPLAGQGINLGLADVQVLAKEIVDAYANDLDWGARRVLGRYQRQRKTDNLAMMAAMEGFKRGFGSANPLIQVARNAGLSWVDRTGPLKRWLARQALA